MCWSSAWRTGGCEAGNAGQGPRSGVIFLPLSPAAKREGYNGRYCANARQMRRPPQDGGQRAPSASPRNGDAKGPWRVRASGNAGKSLSCDPRANACRMCQAPRSVAQTRIKRSALRRRPHATDTAPASNSAAPSPQKEPHCQQITSPPERKDCRGGTCSRT